MPLDLQTPWVRVMLIEQLEQLSDYRWVRGANGPGNESSSEWDSMLDFFDDTGLVAYPFGRIGYTLMDAPEAELMAALGKRLDATMDTPTGEQLRDVAEAAATALQALLKSDS